MNTIRITLEVASEVTGVPVETMLNFRHRARYVTAARLVAIYAMITEFELGPTMIARQLGCDRTVVNYALRKEHNQEIAQRIARLARERHDQRLQALRKYATMHPA